MQSFSKLLSVLLAYCVTIEFSRIQYCTIVYFYKYIACLNMWVQAEYQAMPRLKVGSQYDARHCVRHA